MKPITLLLAAGSLLLSAQGLSAQTDGSGKKEYWNANTLLIPYRLPPAPAGYKAYLYRLGWCTVIRISCVR